MARIKRRPTAPDSLQELIQLAIDLDLTALAHHLPELLQNAEKQGFSYTELAIQMLRIEVSMRQQRRLDRSLKCSKLGTVEGIDGFNFAARPSLEPRVVKELLAGLFIEQHRNVICLGKPGLGKTRIAKTIAQAACMAGYSVLYVVAAEMIESLHASKADNTIKRALHRYIKPDLLVIDEFGYEAFTSEATNYLFRVVSARHHHGSIILIANTGFSHWKNFFPSEAMAVATVDRLVDDATILRFSGKSFRDPREISGAPLEDA